METILIASYRTFIAFLVLLILTRLLGKKQIGQMTFFTYITGIAMGNIAGQMAVEKKIPLAAGITALFIWTFLTLVMEIISLKSGKARRVLDGEPTIVVRRGVIQQQAMKRIRLNMDDLTMLLRTHNIFSIQDVDYAILEPNGKLSVWKNAMQENVTKGDMQIPSEDRLYLPCEIIVDGRIVRKNMKKFGLSQAWLDMQLQAAGLNDPEQVFFAELQSDGTLFIEKQSSAAGG